MNNNLLKIGEMAKLFGISTDTLRHYDKIGLLKPIVDPYTGYRYYSSNHIAILKIILLGKTADIPLEQLKQYIEKGTISSYQQTLEQLSNNIAKKKAELESQELYCRQRSELLAKIQNFSNDYTLEQLETKNININIYTASIDALNTIEIYPSTIEENQGIETWLLYTKGLSIDTDSPEDSYISSFAYRSAPSIQKFEDAMIALVKKGEATRNHFVGNHYCIRFWGTHTDLNEYMHFIFSHFHLPDHMILMIRYLYTMPKISVANSHFVEIYIPVQ